MKIQLETLPATRIAYMRQTGPYGPGNSKAMEALKEWARAHQLLTGSAILFGIPQDNPDTTLPEHCRYDACISVPENAPADKSIHYGEIPGGTYAVVTIQHTAEAVQKAWTEILPALYSSGHLLDYQRPVMERYTGDMISNHLCQLCFPVH
ncbi:GyrI-like domain-containing protein [Paenibacillus sp. FSL R7-0297]|uniref:AraC family transcriptional regulator n=1 Tax=unclassified Paenibacillus TaxID=185978 RepID=UPI0004F5D67A|nr:GyrI-like domain-containing protein [Paenibacillus sp. FSL R5-0912]AIQ41993.1 DNA gyrase inhibitor [Paenibacillus sp. FSL R5-0912]